MGSELLEIRQLTKQFGGLNAVSELDMEVKPGEICGFIGPNGAGKTTVFNLITGFDVPNRGEIRFLNESIIGLQPFQICRRGMTRTFQESRPMFGMTILENITLGALNRIERLGDAVCYSKDIVNFLGLGDFQHILAEDLPIGFRKVLELAKCLATKPKLMLLDEILAGLNSVEVKLILEKLNTIRARGVTILMIEHVMEAVMSICDRVIVLNYGNKLFEGVPDDVIKDPKVIEAYLGKEFTLELTG